MKIAAGVSGRGFALADCSKFYKGLLMFLAACWRLKVMRLEVGEWLRFIDFYFVNLRWAQLKQSRLKFLTGGKDYHPMFARCSLVVWPKFSGGLRKAFWPLETGWEIPLG